MMSRNSDKATAARMIGRPDESRQVALLFALTLLGALACLTGLVSLQGF